MLSRHFCESERDTKLAAKIQRYVTAKEKLNFFVLGRLTVLWWLAKNTKSLKTVFYRRVIIADRHFMKL